MCMYTYIKKMTTEKEKSEEKPTKKMSKIKHYYPNSERKICQIKNF